MAQLRHRSSEFLAWRLHDISASLTRYRDFDRQGFFEKRHIRKVLTHFCIQDALFVFALRHPRTQRQLAEHLSEESLARLNVALTALAEDPRGIAEDLVVERVTSHRGFTGLADKSAGFWNGLSQLAAHAIFQRG